MTTGLGQSASSASRPGVTRVGHGGEGAGVEADGLQLRQRGEGGDEGAQPFVRQGQRVAARQDDFADGGIGGDGGERQAEVTRRQHGSAIIAVAAEAVAAMDGAGAAGHQQRAAAIFADDAARRR